MAADAVVRRDQVSAEEWLQRMRHSAAHVLAQVVLQRWPEAQLGIGPPVESGFYYDFLLPESVTPEILAELEARMRAEIARDHRFLWRSVPAEEARALYAGQPFKRELIDEFGAPEVGLCTHGEFTDLCRGGHVGSTAEIGPFRLTTVAGAYWRGDERRPQLQRLYGALFATEEELAAYFRRLEEARRRDHRRLGRDLKLFTFVEEAGPGVPYLLPKGETIKYLWETYLREIQTAAGFDHVWTAHLARRELFQRSGHLAGYAESMFPPMVDGETALYLKPMNCPSHMALFKSQLHSYRELPVRYAEFATLYRYEKSGELSGLTRVRALTQDDSHIFCTPAQVEDEFARCLRLIQQAMADFGCFEDYRLRLALPDADAKYIAAPEQWAAATAALRSALERSGLRYTEEVGEAAFYGPKADFVATDVLGREWQLSTIQVDFIQPARLGCEYVGEDGARHVPVVLHRAITGSFERLLAVLIEHYEGAFPAWLSPIQARLIPIADRHLPYAQGVAADLRQRGLRADVDTGSERMNAKIRNGQLEKVNYLLVVGDREQTAGAVAVRARGGHDLGSMAVAAFADQLLEEVRTKRR